MDPLGIEGFGKIWVQGSRGFFERFVSGFADYGRKRAAACPHPALPSGCLFRATKGHINITVVMLYTVYLWHRAYGIWYMVYSTG